MQNSSPESASSPSFDTPVLIVGGGPVGLALALDLSCRDIPSVVVEQDPGTATVLLAKAGTLNERTMELCRRWGVSEAVANLGFPSDFPRDTVYCTALNGFFIGRSPMTSADERPLPPWGPEILRKAPQHLFDPMLARVVQERGVATIRYSTRFDSLEQDADGVLARLTDLTTGEPFTLRAAYMVACDGAHSPIREALGVPFEGELLDYSVSAMVRIPELEKHHPLGKGERMMFVGPQGAWANLTAVDGVSLWRFTVVGSEEKLDLATLDLESQIRRAIGRDDVPFEILRIVPWRRSQFLAARYKVGRVLLAGDSAHTTSPTGGHGLNTGIGDVSDLGWMLEAVLRGWGGEALLEAYELERRPVAIRNCGGSTRNYRAWVDSSGREKVLDDTPEGEAARRKIGEQMTAALHQEWHSTGVGMGYRYEGSPLIAADGTPEPADDPSVYIQTARPGHRAPHAWLADGRSTLDLFGRGFVLLRFGEPAADARSLTAAAARVGMPLEVVDIADPQIAALYERKLVLVRPDGQVAWRADQAPADATALIDRVRGAIRARVPAETPHAEAAPA
jgi:2-polyprenyl-6-methoxyphenol hydroxylase-like FAD-dependent oxidoreductase